MLLNDPINAQDFCLFIFPFFFCYFKQRRVYHRGATRAELGPVPDSALLTVFSARFEHQSAVHRLQDQGRLPFNQNFRCQMEWLFSICSKLAISLVDKKKNKQTENHDGCNDGARTQEKGNGNFFKRNGHFRSHRLGKSGLPPKVVGLFLEISAS